MHLKLILPLLALAMSACSVMPSKPERFTVITKEASSTFSGQVIITADDYVYIGAMKEGKRDGYGVSYFKHGLIQAGQWHNDQLEGEAVVIAPDVGSVSAGHFSQDQQSGAGVVVLDGEVVQGEFESGKAIPTTPHCFKHGTPIPCSDSGLL